MVYWRAEELYAIASTIVTAYLAGFSELFMKEVGFALLKAQQVDFPYTSLAGFATLSLNGTGTWKWAIGDCLWKDDTHERRRMKDEGVMTAYEHSTLLPGAVVPVLPAGSRNVSAYGYAGSGASI